MTRAIKEITMLLIFCLIIMLFLAIVLYRYIPSRKQIPEIQIYSASEEVQDLLEDDIASRTDETEPVETYKITSSDMKNYKTKQDYIPGKVDPFAEYTENTTVEDPNVGTTSGGTTSGGTTSGDSGDKIDTPTTPNIDTHEPSVYTGEGGTNK